MCAPFRLPDFHPGKGHPVGAASIFRDALYSHLVCGDIGCGMGLWQLDVKVHTINTAQWERKLGTIGGGNHFAEVQAVFDAEALAMCGLNRCSVVLLVHSGSRGFEQAIQTQYIRHDQPAQATARTSAATDSQPVRPTPESST